MSDTATRAETQGGSQPDTSEHDGDEQEAPDDGSGPAQDDSGTDDGQQGGGHKKKLSRKARVRLVVIIAIAVVAGGFFLVRYFVETKNYVSTDNAQVDGNQISINAPATGTLLDWRGQQGAVLRQYGSVGRIELEGGYVQPQKVIRAPVNATVAVDNGIAGSYVTAGTQLAIAYDSSGIFVTARVDETDIDGVRVGAPVQLDVDAFPGAGLTGHVSEVQTGAAGVFSALPQSNTSGNFQKVTQVIPVKITFDDMKGLPLVPGMNVTTKIRRP